MPKVDEEQAKEELRRLFQGWTRAVGAEKDYAFLERHLGDGWRYIDLAGAQRERGEYLKFVEQIVSYEQEMRRFDVQLVSDGLAIITGVYHSRGEVKSGLKVENTIAFSAVWALQDGVWRALLHHTTRIQPPP